MVFFDVHRTCGRCRACTVHRTPTRCSSRRVYGITDSADEGLFGGWAQAIYLEPGVAHGAAARRRVARRLHRRRLRAADRGSHRRARRDPPRRHASSCRAPAPSACARSRSRALAGAVDDHRARRARRSAGAGARRWAPTSRIDIQATTPARAPRDGARRDPRGRGRRGDRGGGRGRGDRRRAWTWRASADATSSPGTTPTSGERRSTRTARSTASTSRSEAAGAASRGISCARCRPRTPPADSVPRDRRQDLRARPPSTTRSPTPRRCGSPRRWSIPSHEDAMRHTKIVATLGPSSSARRCSTG